MADAAPKPVYLVDAYSEPAIVKINGRAAFNSCGCLRDFFQQMVKEGKRRFVVDFLHCTSMDSTFLGVLAGTAITLRKLTPPGSLTLCRVGQRNLELIRNLGLHRLLYVDAGEFPMQFTGQSSPSPQPLLCPNLDELAAAKLALEAHENLVVADPQNLGKFQDVLAFLKNRVESK